MRAIGRFAVPVLWLSCALGATECGPGTIGAAGTDSIGSSGGSSGQLGGTALNHGGGSSGGTTSSSGDDAAPDPGAADDASEPVMSGITVTPSNVAVAVGATQSFSCVVASSPSATCTWAVNGTGGGRITSAGLYTAPSTVGTYQVVATSAVAPSAMGTAKVTVFAPDVGSCSMLPAVGTWQKITPPAFTAQSNLEVTTVAVDPQNPGIVYASAGNKTNGGDGSLGIYKSSDCGGSWSKISTPGSPLETGDVWQLFVDPVTSQTLYATNGYGDNPVVYRSTDGAVTWKATPTNLGGGLQVRAISMDPSNPQHLVACMHNPCTVSGNPLCLSETQNGGTSWTLIQGPPISAADQGGDGGGPMIVAGGVMLYLHPSAGVFYTNNDGASWTKQFQWYNYPGTSPPTVYNSAFPTTYGSPGLGYVGTKGIYISFDSTGVFEIPAPYNVTTLKAADWQLLKGSPSVTGGLAMIDDGTTLYGSGLNDSSGQPYHSAPVTAGTPWTQMPAKGVARGASTFSYDASHHVVYSANWGAGLWRLVSH